MKIYKAKIIREYSMINSVTYVFNVEGMSDVYPIFAALYHSDEQNFMVNHFGATSELRIGKNAYLTFNTDTKRIMSISNNLGDTMVIEAFANGSDRTLAHNDLYIREAFDMSTEEFKKLTRSEVKTLTLNK